MICCKCKTVINGGRYNVPSGTYCIDCWESETPERRKKENEIAIKSLAYATKTMLKNIGL
jgi:recombinational DNA repair protein (RecF pathway)